MDQSSGIHSFTESSGIHRIWIKKKNPVESNQRLQKLVFLASMLDVQQLKGQCEASIVCGRQMGRWQLDSKTERSFRCLLAKATW